MSDEPLYTNTGDWYYDKVSSSVSKTYSFSLHQDEIMLANCLTVTIDNGTPIELDEFPAWSSESSVDIGMIPLFIFKTTNGKYGVEGIVSGYTDPNNAEDYFTKFGGMVYYRFTQGDAQPTYYYIFDATSDNSTFSVTLSNGQVTVTGATTVPAISGTYELYLTGNTSGEYVFGKDMTVIDSTEFYICGNYGSAAYIYNPSTDAMEMLYGQDTSSCIGKGTLSTATQSSNLTTYLMGASSSGDIELSTTDASEGDGEVLNYLQIGDYGSIMYCFLVPTEIRESDEPDEPDEPEVTSAMPKMSNIPMAGWYPVRKMTLKDFSYKTGGFTVPSNTATVLMINAPGYIGYVYTDTSGSSPVRKVKLYGGTSEVSNNTSVTAEVYLLIE